MAVMETARRSIARQQVDPHLADAVQAQRPTIPCVQLNRRPTGGLATSSWIGHLNRLAGTPSGYFAARSHGRPCRVGSSRADRSTGEAGAVGAPPAVMNAIVDALKGRVDVRHIDMPATQQRVWKILNGVH